MTRHAGLRNPFMRHRAIAGAAVFSLILLPSAASAQNYEAMAKWTDAKVIRYHVSGDFAGSGRITGGQGAAQAKFTDHVEFDFDWDNAEMKVIGKPVIKNFPTKVTDVVPGTWRGMPCPAAKIEGAFEHWTMESIQSATAIMQMNLDLQGKRDWPAASVPYGRESSTGSCGQLWETLAAGAESMTVKFELTLAMSLEMPEALPAQFTVSKDRKSFIEDKKDGWIWTLTPTIVK
jgi:hypothetical protein